MPPAVRVRAGGPGWDRLPRGVGAERAAAVPGHARAAGRTDLRARQADQQEFAPAQARSSGIYTKIA